MGMKFERRQQADDSWLLFAKLPSGKWHGPYDKDNCEVKIAEEIIDKPYSPPPPPTELTVEQQLDMGDQGPIKRLSEDLVDLLIEKGIIVASDLALQSEYTERRILRGV